MAVPFSDCKTITEATCWSIYAHNKYAETGLKGKKIWFQSEQDFRLPCTFWQVPFFDPISSDPIWAGQAAVLTRCNSRLGPLEKYLFLGQNYSTLNETNLKIKNISFNHWTSKSGRKSSFKRKKPQTGPGSDNGTCMLMAGQLKWTHTHKRIKHRWEDPYAASPPTERKWERTTKEKKSMTKNTDVFCFVYKAVHHQYSSGMRRD